MFVSPFVLVTLFATNPADPTAFIATGRADSRPIGKLIKLNNDGSAELAMRVVNAGVSELISLRRAALPLPAFPRGPLLITSAGDRISGKLIGGNDQSLRFQPAFAGVEWEVPLSGCTVLWLDKPPAGTPIDSS